jgi:hypothetical protein
MEGLECCLATIVARTLCVCAVSVRFLAAFMKVNLCRNRHLPSSALLCAMLSGFRYDSLAWGVALSLVTTQLCVSLCCCTFVRFVRGCFDSSRGLALL